MSDVGVLLQLVEFGAALVHTKHRLQREAAQTADGKREDLIGAFRSQVDIGEGCGELLADPCGNVTLVRLQFEPELRVSARAKGNIPDDQVFGAAINLPQQIDE